MKRFKHANEGTAEPKRSTCPTPIRNIRDYDPRVPKYRGIDKGVEKIQKHHEKYDK